MGTYVEIAYGLFDVTAKDDSTPVCTDVQPFASMEQLKETDLAVEKYATCEHNQFILDGSMKLFPDEPVGKNFGLWSKQMSGTDGNFKTPIELDITFTENHSSLGLTLYFFPATGDYATNVNIKYYGAEEVLILEKNYTPDSAIYFAPGQVENYRRVVLTFYSTSCPYRYLKLTEIKYGVLRVFGRDDVLTAELLEEVDPLSSELSINTLDFRVYTKDFAIMDPQGVYTLLQRKQEVEVAEYVDGIKRPMGTFYLETPESDTEHTTGMSCIDAIGIMDQSEFKGGMYSNKKASDLVAEIMASARLPYILDATIGEKTVSGWLPVCTHREALQQVAFATGAIVDCSRSDKVNIVLVPNSAAAAITKNEKLNNHKVKQKSLVTGVEVVVHKYVENLESVELCNQQLGTGLHEIVFPEAYHSLAVTGGTIIESNANYAKIKVTATSSVVLTGKGYLDQTSLEGVYAPNLPAGEKHNILKVEDATLISNVNAKEVAQRVYDYYQLRYEGEGTIKAGETKVGELYTMESQSNKSIEGIIESMTIDLTGGFLADIKITGKAV